WPARVGAGPTDAGVVADRAFEHPDRLVSEMAMAGDHGAGDVADQHGAAVAFLPQRLPVDTGPALHPRPQRRIDVEADGRGGHGRSTSTASPTTRTGYTGTARSASTRHWPDRKSTRLNSSHVAISYA